MALSGLGALSQLHNQYQMGFNKMMRPESPSGGIQSAGETMSSIGSPNSASTGIQQSFSNSSILNNGSTIGKLLGAANKMQTASTAKGSGFNQMDWLPSAFGGSIQDVFDKKDALMPTMKYGDYNA